MIVKVTCVSPLPLFTWLELSAQVLNGGQLAEGDRITLLGNLPPERALNRDRKSLAARQAGIRLRDSV